MNLMVFVRNKAFWLLDYLRRSPVKKAYLEIERIDKMDSDNPYISEYQKEAWEKLKQNACSTTQIYKSYKYSKFEDFPVINKQDIRSNQEHFLSCQYERERLIQMATSGSTGTPFICYQNNEKKSRVNAEVIYYSEKAGYRLGENLIYIRTIVKQNKKNKLKQFLQNQTLINCSHLDDRGIQKILHLIKRYSRRDNVTLLAYASTYTAIKDYCERKKIHKLENQKVQGIISGSEMLFDDTRNIIGRIFGNVKVVSRYSNEENGVLGQDEGINNVFPINEADYIIEIVDDGGRKVPIGTVGRIVVTDLYNYAMPMIRYDTGDVGAIEVININGRKKRCISNFSGRRVDMIYDTTGKRLSPHLITNYMWSFPDINQFQLIQKGKKNYLLRLNVKKTYDRIDEIKGKLSSILGSDAVIDVEVVNEIPVLASGKRRYIVNEYMN